MAGGEPQVFPGQGCGQARAAAESESGLCPCSAPRLRCPSERLCFPRLKVCRGRLGELQVLVRFSLQLFSCQMLSGHLGS